MLRVCLCMSVYPNELRSQLIECDDGCGGRRDSFRYHRHALNDDDDPVCDK